MIKRKTRVTLCPFHEERTPSCNFDPEHDSFHCFGCGKEGRISDYPEHVAKFMGMKSPEAKDRDRFITDIYDDLDQMRIKLGEIIQSVEELR